MFLPCLVMCVYGLNNTESIFPCRISKPNLLLLLSIMMFGDHLRSLPPKENMVVTFIDDLTRLIWVFLISDKFEVTSTFWDFYHTIETQFNTKIAILRSDNGREFQNHPLIL